MKIRIDEFCTQLIILCSAAMLILSGIIGIESAKYCIYAIVALCCVKTLYLKFKVAQFVSLVLVFAMSFMVVWIHGGSLPSLLIFITSLLLAISFSCNGIDAKSWKLLKICTYAVCLYFIGYMLVVGNYSVYGQLMLYFDNPNMSGIAISAPTIMLILMLSDDKGKRINLINWVFLITMGYMLYSTQNRGSLLALILLFVVAVVAIYSKKPKRLCSRWAWNLLKLTPIIVMFVYIGMYMLLPSTIEVFGKPLFSGREGAWISALEKIFTDPFAYHVFEEGTLNLFLEGAARYGVLSMLGYFSLLVTFGKKKSELREMSVTSFLAYVAFHCCLFQQSFESTMLTGSYGVYVWSYILLGVASMQHGYVNSAMEARK